MREHPACSQWPGKAAELGCHFPSPRNICRTLIVSSFYVDCEKELEMVWLVCVKTNTSYTEGSRSLEIYVI